MQDLPQQFVHNLSIRVASLNTLNLPSSLLKEDVTPSVQTKQDYLSTLLIRDPALFLERHGSLLTIEEVNGFAPLLHDYEVRWWCEQLQPSEQTLSQQRSVKKNRRIAYMHKVLMPNGYFDEHSMFLRAPAVYEEHLGEYKPAELAEEDADAQGMATWFLNQNDVALAQAALRRERQPTASNSHQAAQPSQQRNAQPQNGAATAQQRSRQPQHNPVAAQDAEFESEHESDKEGGVEAMQEDTPATANANAAGGTPALVQNGAQATSAQQGLQNGENATTEASSVQEAAQAVAEENAAAGQNRGQFGEMQGQDNVQETAAKTLQGGDATETTQGGNAAERDAVQRVGRVQGEPAAVDGTARQQDMQRAGSSQSMALDLLYVMQQRFLDGLDKEYVNYTEIDANTSLDDYFAASQQQDAEDKYFADV